MGWEHLLVVGGNGFIGRHVVKKALEKGLHVTVLSSSGSAGSPDAVCLQADLADAAQVANAIKGRGFEYVVNCGGYVDHQPFSKGGQRVADVHLGGVFNLVSALNRKRLKRFVNIGSSDEYGNLQGPQDEKAREAPISPYSFAKVAATHFLQMLYRMEAFPSVTLRLFLCYGPGQDDRRFLPQIIKGCLGHKSFPTSEGHQLRDFCYVDDVVEAIFAALLTNGIEGEVFNIASGQPVSIREIISQVSTIAGAGHPQFGEVPYRPGENMELYADVEKARTLLGWQPSTSLEQGLSMTIEWFRSVT